MVPSAPTNPDREWPGKRLGLPESGPRSVGRIGRRILALLIDWLIAYGLVAVLRLPNPSGFTTLGVFAALQVLFLLVLNGSIGHLITGMRVVPVIPGYLGWWRPFLRTIFLCVVIPAVVFDKDQRGLHDRWIGTVLVRR